MASIRQPRRPQPRPLTTKEWEAAFASRLSVIAERHGGPEVAERTGFSEGDVRRYMATGTAPGAFLAALREAMGINAEWLLHGRGSPEGP